jgi:dTDP-4-amino-4,6-dideoxygalactose transaminase
MKSPHQVTRDFEAALCEYTGAPYAVAVTSCTMALLLAVRYQLEQRAMYELLRKDESDWEELQVEIPKRTYVSVPMSIIHAGGRPTFRDEIWSGRYQLEPLNVWDYARYFTSGMWLDRLRCNHAGSMLCVSFHWSKTLGLQQGGAILHDNPEADKWLRRARFDGRAEGVAPKDDVFTFAGWHCYMSPEVAALGLMRLSLLPKHNEPLPNDDYPDLSQMEVFK